MPPLGGKPDLQPILSVVDLRVRFDTHHGTVRAVDGVSFHVEAGETLGIVGESGSGKSVTCLAVMGLLPTPPASVDGGRIFFHERNLMLASERELRSIRGNHVSMIFQDPMTSLNPLLTVGQQLTEVLEVHKGTPRREARRLAAAGLGEVGIPTPEARLDSYPHQLSGGMRQRVMIAMALLCRPQVLFADEPTTALDVTVQAQILELMRDLQEKHGTGIVLITHDLGVVAGMADRVQVMYAGRLAETGATGALFGKPRHPYTKGLLTSIPTLTGDPEKPLPTVEGQPPDLADLPPGCAFAPRCPWVQDECRSTRPDLEVVPSDEPDETRTVACFEHRQVVKGGPQ